ncbi:L,D-transpeptidase family protein [Pseudaeromonas paramecii]|uniref:L,D-transpeptidase family protein n=1 Tax=Pseudaeromonas paramecii TaxID=2138166 RepID=A0ABP8QJ21_9GAMM
MRRLAVWLFLLCSLPVQAAWFVPPDVDLIVVEKARHSLVLYHQGQPIKRYWVALGSNPLGHKLQQGDGRTPEGRYTIDARRPQSRFYKALHISYPNEEDRRSAQARGVSPGSDILIHGQPNGSEALGVQSSYWTNGCIGLLNGDMDELWQVVKEGTPIEIRP